MKLRSTFSIIIAGILWGCISIFIKKLIQFDFTPLQISAIRSFFSALIMLIIILIRNPALLKIRLSDIWCFIGTGIVSLALFNWCYFYTIGHCEASIAVILLYTSPIFVMLFSSIIFREKITIKKLIAVLICFSGCVLVSGLGDTSVSLPLKIILTGVASGIFYALYSIFGRFAIERYNTYTVTVYTFIFASLFNIFICHPLDILSKFSISPNAIITALSVAIFCTILPYCLYTYGLTHTTSANAAILVTIEPLVGTLIGILLYNEPHNISKLIGMLLIFIAVILLEININRKK